MDAYRSFLTRRRFLQAGVAGLAGAALGGCSLVPTMDASGDPRLQARPGTPTGTVEPGEHVLDEFVDGECKLFVPDSYVHGTPSPLFVMLHGAGPSRNQVDLFFLWAQQHGILMLTPRASDATWDMVLGRFGPDVALLDRVLRHTFSVASVDTARLGIGGFSDGASYGLSMGLTNGDLFSHVVGFSPGFLIADRRVGRPRVFISHGTADPVLPINTTRRLAERIDNWGYDLTFREFAGQHTVPTNIANQAFEWLTA